MKVILVNGSIHEFGCTHEALTIMQEKFQELGIDSEIIFIGDEAINDFSTREEKADVVDEIGQKMAEADGLVIGSPTWYSHPTGRLLCVLDRLSRKYKENLAYKPACSVATARRAGQVFTNDIINKHFGINNMPIVTSTYWNLVFGSTKEDVRNDLEGVATLVNLASNMAWLIKSIHNSNLEKPTLEKARMNFFH